MKKLQYLVIVALFAMANTAQSQISVNVNLGTPPVWAPAKAERVQYYYLPEVDSYYDVPSKRFIYLNNGKWKRSAALPAHYRYYNLKKGKTVFITDYHGDAPYLFHKEHKVKYGFAKIKSKKHHFKNNKKLKSNKHGKKK